MYVNVSQYNTLANKRACTNQNEVQDRFRRQVNRWDSVKLLVPIKIIASIYWAPIERLNIFVDSPRSNNNRVVTDSLLRMLSSSAYRKYGYTKMCSTRIRRSVHWRIDQSLNAFRIPPSAAIWFIDHLESIWGGRELSLMRMLHVAACSTVHLTGSQWSK